MSTQKALPLDLTRKSLATLRVQLSPRLYSYIPEPNNRLACRYWLRQRGFPGMPLPPSLWLRSVGQSCCYRIIILGTDTADPWDEASVHPQA